MTAESQRGEPQPANPDTERTPEDIEAEFTRLWEDGDRLGALEAVMGRYISSKEVVGDPDFASVILQPNSSKAYAVASMAKMLKKMTGEE